ncbi:MAG: hypothetical protein PUE95_02855 [Lachnospiraceae bacterium]|nr:hypothetical protein [Lachnospiraceae bacterium]
MNDMENATNAENIMPSLNVRDLLHVKKEKKERNKFRPPFAASKQDKNA